MGKVFASEILQEWLDGAIPQIIFYLGGIKEAMATLLLDTH